MSKLYIVGEQKDGIEGAKRYFFKAHDALKAGKWIKAIQYLKHSLKSKPDYLPALRNLAEIYQQHENLKEAQKYINKALKTDPNDPVILFFQGVNQISRGDFKAAIESFLRAQENGDLTWGLAYNLGLCHYALNNYDSSLPYLDKAIRMDSSQPQPYLLLAQIFVRQNKADMAIGMLRKAKKMRPNDQDLDLMISDIMDLIKQPNG